MKPELVQTINTIAEMLHKTSEQSSVTLKDVDQKQFYKAVHHYNRGMETFKGTHVDNESIETISFNVVIYNLARTAECIVTVTTIA